MTDRPEGARREWLRPPPDTPEYMMPAWVGAIDWALGKEDIVAAFRAATGIQWEPGRTPIERMIDKVAGSEERFLHEFVAWFNLNIWGSIEAPDDDAES